MQLKTEIKIIHTENYPCLAEQIPFRFHLEISAVCKCGKVNIAAFFIGILMGDKIGGLIVSRNTAAAFIYPCAALQHGIGFNIFAAPCAVCIFKGIWVLGGQSKFSAEQFFKIYGLIAVVFHGYPSGNNVAVRISLIVQGNGKGIYRVRKIQFQTVVLLCIAVKFQVYLTATVKKFRLYRTASIHGFTERRVFLPESVKHRVI